MGAISLNLHSINVQMSYIESNRDTIKDIIENKNKSEQEVIDAAIDKVKLRQENNNFFDEIQEYRKEIKEILKLK